MSQCTCSHANHKHFYPAPTRNEVLENGVVNYINKTTILKDIRSEILNEPSQRWTYLKGGNIDTILVDQVLSFELCSMDKAQKIWASHSEHTATLLNLMVFAGAAGFAFSVWKAAWQRSINWTLVVVIDLLAIWFFGKKLGKVIQKDINAAKQLEAELDKKGQPVKFATMIANCRQILIEKGLGGYEETLSAMKPYYISPETSLRFVTDSELAVLLNDWVTSLQTSGLAKEICESPLLKLVHQRASLSETALKPIVCMISNLRHEKIVKRIMDSIDRNTTTISNILEGNYKADPQNENTKLLMERFNNQIRETKHHHTEEAHQQLLENQLTSQLKLFQDQLERFNRGEELSEDEDAIDKAIRSIVAEHLREIFRAVFDSKEVPNHVEYVENARHLFNQLPDNFQLKKFLLDQLPKQ